MPWPIKDGWNQHLDEMNRRQATPTLTVSLVRIEPPFEVGWPHTEHVHPYWQMEVVRHGNFSVSFGHKRIKPKKGEILLIPPQTWHFFHQEKGKASWTVKFNVAELEELYPAAVLPGRQFAKILHLALDQALELFTEQATEPARMTIEHLLAGIIALYCFEQKRPAGSNTQLLQKARRQIEEATAACKAIQVQEIAARNNVSTAYLNRIFRRCLGIPAKVYIDQYRFEIAQKLLNEANLSITQVAEEMGFDDVFRFSRFFKRMSGMAPLKFRAKQ